VEEAEPVQRRACNAYGHTADNRRQPAAVETQPGGGDGEQDGGRPVGVLIRADVDGRSGGSGAGISWSVSPGDGVPVDEALGVLDGPRRQPGREGEPEAGDEQRDPGAQDGPRPERLSPKFAKSELFPRP
jgi:hypothetical protein